MLHSLFFMAFFDLGLDKKICQSGFFYIYLISFQLFKHISYHFTHTIFRTAAFFHLPVSLTASDQMKFLQSTKKDRQSSTYDRSIY